MGLRGIIKHEKNMANFGDFLLTILSTNFGDTFFAYYCCNLSVISVPKHEKDKLISVHPKIAKPIFCLDYYNNLGCRNYCNKSGVYGSA